jgi:hypothetical protein
VESTQAMKPSASKVSHASSVSGSKPDVSQEGHRDDGEGGLPVNMRGGRWHGPGPGEETIGGALVRQGSSKPACHWIARIVGVVARRGQAPMYVARGFYALAASCVHCPREPGPKHPGGRFPAWHATTAATVGLPRSTASPGRAMDKLPSGLQVMTTPLPYVPPRRVPHHDLPHRHAVSAAPSPDASSVQGAQSLTRTTLGPRMCAFGLWRGVRLHQMRSIELLSWQSHHDSQTLSSPEPGEPAMCTGRPRSTTQAWPTSELGAQNLSLV